LIRCWIFYASLQPIDYVNIEVFPPGQRKEGCKRSVLVRSSLHAKFAAAVLFLVASSLQAQSPVPQPPNNQAPGEVLASLADLNFEIMGAKQGLPHDSVYGITQDSRGLLWIATFGGLSRYDGYRLHNYTHDEHYPSSLPDNNIRVILPAANGGLWIATGNAGVISYDPATDTFHPLPHLPDTLRHSHTFCMADDGEGGLWFGSQLGLAHYIAKSHSYELFGKVSGKTAAQGFAEGSVFSVLKDREGNLWIGGDHGLLVRRAGSNHFEAISGLAGDAQLGEFPPVWTIFEDGEGRIWIGTDKSGVGILNPATNRIEAVPTLAGHDSLIGAATVRGIVEVRKNQFWIATYGSGLVTFDLSAGHGRRYARDLTAAAPLSNNFLRGIFLGSSGIVWLGTDRGLSKVNSAADGLLTIHSSPLRTAGLQGNEVRSVTAQQDRLWVGFDQGGFAVIEADGRIRNATAAPGVKDTDLSKREVLAIKAADSNVVYAGGLGLYEIDAKRLTYKPVPNPIFAKQVVNALLVDGNDVWVGSYDGLTRYDRTTHEAHLYAHDVSHADSLSDNYVRDMLKASDGRFWITTRLGLDCFDAASETFHHYKHSAKDPDSLPSDNVQPIAEDLQGRLWIGTIGDGITVLQSWTPDGKPHFRTLNRHNGFPDDIVLTVMRGDDGRIWSNTPGGLAVIDPATLKAHTYTAGDGLRTSSQNLFGSATLRDGTIVFPGDQGLIVVRPALLKSARPLPPLVATDIAVPGSSLSPAALAWRSLQQNIVLTPAHPAFRTSFALLDYTAPEEAQYSYKLDGFDKDWSDSTLYNRTAAYTNLPAGKYRLLIHASHRLKAGSFAQLVIPITVQSAWYDSFWFLTLKILAACGILFLAVRLRTAVIEGRRAELERDVASRTAELAKNQAELVLANERLAELATRDPLTSAFNRRHFLEVVEDEIARSRRSGRPFTLLLIDADNFKSINDDFGHMAGDEVLRKLVQRLGAQLRTNDVMARYGGEEFVVLLADTSLRDGLQLAERLRTEAANSRTTYGGHVITGTISIGATEATGKESIDDLMHKADEALYAAKNAGRNRVVATE
jgi:diguanylate cyclase (GGDEF)-like protein